MTTPPDGFGSAPTPPAFVRQLEEEQHELERKHASVKSLVAANHIATLHQLGALAGTIEGLTEDVKTLTGRVDAALILLHKLAVHMGVPS